MKNCFIAIFFLVTSLAQAQRVGLVMSGGGAKGIAHIGLLQVLEDHDIPIDYITGTSMGAIVGSLYAMGYSPSEMMDLIKSDKFKYWQSGVIKEEDMIYYLKNEPTPEWVQFNINFRKDAPKKTQAYFIPASIVNPVQMNAAFLGLYGQAGGASGYNFDNLFVPYRCVSADTYNKNTLISKDGDLGMAVRASMTFPFVFSPIRINGNLMYDGGIYNNFPADIMMDEFNPDFMIGSSVTGTPNRPAERDIMAQLENMVMQKTDYSIPKEKGIYIRSHLKDYGIMDFEKADSIYQVGYNMGMQFLDSIQGKIKRRVPKESVELRRMMYKSKLPDLVFDKISVNGVTYAQKEYIAAQIRKNDNGTFT
ncbi:MAG: patatin-like phospholipase family protein, partial [Bacteroidales bacterium]